MRTKTTEPERVNLRFADEVLAAFDFLTTEYGFHRTKVDVTFIRYESRDVFVNVYHGRSSYELGLEIGRFAERVGAQDVEFGLGNIIEVMGASAETGYTFFQASTPEKVKSLVPRLADLLKEYGKAALIGDPLFFSKLRDDAARKSDDYLKQIQLSRVREQVVQAWHQKNYVKVVELYDQVRDDLTPAEIKKLEYARKHVSMR